jgi:hypothetical protein
MTGPPETAVGGERERMDPPGYRATHSPLRSKRSARRLGVHHLLGREAALDVPGRRPARPGRRGDDPTGAIPTCSSLPALGRHVCRSLRGRSGMCSA